MGSCSKLGVLSLRDNRVSYLPSELGRLQNLHVLDVSGNKLQYLPTSITQCHLTALWMSENQAKPMLSLQRDFDQQGNEVLTCFLLPQQAYHTESMENLLKGSIATEDSRISWNDLNHSWGEHTRTSVKFADEKQEEEEEPVSVREH